MNEKEIIIKIQKTIEKCKEDMSMFAMPTLDGVKVETTKHSHGTIFRETHKIHVSAEITLIVEHEWWDSSRTYEMRPDKNKVTISGGSLTESIIAVWDEKN